MATGSRQSPARQAPIDSSVLLSWGANSHGQLGQSNTDDQLVPKPSTLGTVAVQQLTGGGGHTFVLTAEGSVLVCGSNASGQLGVPGSGDVSCFTPVSFPSPVKILQVAAGWDFSLGVTENGAVYSWGNNSFCQLGRETSAKTAPQPEAIQEGLAGVKVLAVAAGLRHALALSDEGEVYGWGQNRRGQVGHITDSDGTLQGKVPVPQRLTLPSDLPKPVQVATGANHSALRTASGTVYMWGCNKYGQTSQDPSKTPQVSQPCCISASAFGGQRVKHIACGWTHNLALTDSDTATTVYSWGRADYGQLGRSCDQSCDPAPKAVEKLSNVCAVACGSEHNLAVTDDGRLFSWGWNEHGMCGTGHEQNVLVPIQIDGGAETIAIGCGAGHSFALVRR